LGLNPYEGIALQTGVWETDDFPGNGWQRIICLPESRNWFLQAIQAETALGLGGYGGDDATWRITPETGVVTISDVSYDVSAAITSLNVPPVSFMSVGVDNTAGNTDLIQTTTLDGSITNTQEFDLSTTNATTVTIATSITAEVSFEEVAKVTATDTAERSAEKSTTWAHNTIQSDTMDHTIQTQVTVPAGKVYSFNQTINYGTIFVPYTAAATFQSMVPGSSQQQLTLSGKFSGLNATTSTITVSDVTPVPSSGPVSKPQATVVAAVTMPVSRSTPAQQRTDGTPPAVGQA
jgi:hypothetical protein